MTRKELVERLFGDVRNSGLSLNEQMMAITGLRTRMDRFRASPSGRQKKDFAPLTRPSGKVMGKQKSQPKD
jgi:hypothetical protein